MNKIYKFFMKSMYTISFGLIFLIFLNAYYLSYNEIIGDQWAYQELFINYSAGFIRKVFSANFL